MFRTTFQRTNVSSRTCWGQLDDSRRGKTFVEQEEKKRPVLRKKQHALPLPSRSRGRQTFGVDIPPPPGHSAPRQTPTLSLVAPQLANSSLVQPVDSSPILAQTSPTDQEQVFVGQQDCRRHHRRARRS